MISLDDFALFLTTFMREPVVEKQVEGIAVEIELEHCSDFDKSYKDWKS